MEPVPDPRAFADEARAALAETLAADVPTPALVVDLDAVRANVAVVLARVGGPARWRPHVKTAKLDATLAELARAGLDAFKCATVREARRLLAVLAAEGVERPDVLLAHPLRGPGLAALARLAVEHPAARVSVLVEDAEHAAALPAPLGAFVDLNVGMDRTGIPAADSDGVVAVARAAGARLRGLHAYEGHLHDGTLAERAAAAAPGHARVAALARRLAELGLPCEEVVTSGTPGFPAALDDPSLAPAALGGARHTVSPGTVVYHDLRAAEQLPGVPLAFAALVLARVVSHPAPDLATCDAGSKSLAAEAGDPCARALGRPGLVALPPSEEHLPLRVARGPRPPRGAALLLAPRHVCPTVNLAEQAVLLEGGRATGLAPVSARGHELSEGPSPA